MFCITCLQDNGVVHVEDRSQLHHQSFTCFEDPRFKDIIRHAGFWHCTHLLLVMHDKFVLIAFVARALETRDQHIPFYDPRDEFDDL